MLCPLQVTDLKSQLLAARSQQDKLKVELESARSAGEAANKREAQLRAEAEELRFLMDEAHATADAAHHAVSGQSGSMHASRICGTATYPQRQQMLLSMG